MVAQWLALSLIAKGPGFNSQLEQGLSVWSLHVLQGLLGFPLGAPDSPTIKTHTLGVSSVGNLDQGAG